MSSLNEQDPLSPNNPEFYAPPRLRERAAKLGQSLSQEARLEPIRSSSISLPASLDVQPKNEVSDASWNPLDPAVINQPAGLAWDRRTAQLGVAAAAAGVVTVVVLLFVIMKPAPRQSDAGSTPPEVSGSTRTAPPQSVEGPSDRSPRLQCFKRSSHRSRLASLLLKSSPSSCFSSFCNGVKKLTQPKHLNSADAAGGNRWDETQSKRASTGRLYRQTEMPG